MAATATVDSTYSALHDTTQATQIVRGSIALSGNYGSASSHGDTLALNLYGIQSATLVRCFIYEQPAAGTAPTGTLWGYAKGTTLANGLLTAMTAYNTEYSEGSAYTTAQKAAVLRFEAVFETFK
jgi:Na+/glutamate symporter